MTISGGRPRQNDARLDGISVNDYANGSPGSALGVNLGVDAVEQFTVLTSNYPAQVGRSSGGVVGASTRGGTNNFMGMSSSFCEIVRWMHGIFLILRSRSSAAINLERPLAGPSGKTVHTFSATMKGCGNLLG